MGINLPNGGNVEEIILPNGANTERVIGPDGSTLWERNAIPDSVVTQYEFEDDSDTSVAVDAVGSNDADITGASYSSDSKCGSLALQTDGTNDIIISQQSVDLVADGDAEAAAVGGFMKKDSESLSDNIGWAADSDNRLQASTNDTNYRGVLSVNGTEEFVDSGVAIDTSNYVHVVVSVDQNDLWIIIDGTEEARTSHSLDITNIGSGDLHTGARIDDEFEYDGLTDNATFANDALSESDTQQLIDQC